MMKRRSNNPLPSQMRLRELLSFDTETGKLTWKKKTLRQGDSAREINRWNTRNSGREALTSDCKGYRVGTVDGVAFYAHRVIWKWNFGFDPLFIDHINGIPSDNRLANLRDVDMSLNARNRKLTNANSSGHAGVTWVSGEHRWRAQIVVRQKYIYLGHFNILADAVRARKKAETKFGFHRNHGRIAA